MYPAQKRWWKYVNPWVGVVLCLSLSVPAHSVLVLVESSCINKPAVPLILLVLDTAESIKSYYLSTPEFITRSESTADSKMFAWFNRCIYALFKSTTPGHTPLINLVRLVVFCFQFCMWHAAKGVWLCFKCKCDLLPTSSCWKCPANSNEPECTSWLWMLGVEQFSHK